MAEANFEEQLEIVDREYREGCEHALFSMYIYTSAFFLFCLGELTKKGWTKRSLGLKKKILLSEFEAGQYNSVRHKYLYYYYYQQNTTKYRRLIIIILFLLGDLTEKGFNRKMMQIESQLEELTRSTEVQSTARDVDSVAISEELASGVNSEMEKTIRSLFHLQAPANASKTQSKKKQPKKIPPKRLSSTPNKLSAIATARGKKSSTTAPMPSTIAPKPTKLVNPKGIRETHITETGSSSSSRLSSSSVPITGM